MTPRGKLVFLTVLRDIRGLLENRTEPCLYCPNRNDLMVPALTYCYFCRLTVSICVNHTENRCSCPCNVLGPEEAVKRAWITIDEHLSPEEK